MFSEVVCAKYVPPFYNQKAYTKYTQWYLLRPQVLFQATFTRKITEALLNA